ncbi:MAG TPA: indolepyruvate ferredoxin oxidoreductase family protein [Solirubrobacterales bacterium]|nr:indolepyruvate ferredoxin oxidoreductase family protein [Solirubrobacterales bacterium]
MPSAKAQKTDEAGRTRLDLRERLTSESGWWYMPAMQAIARLPFEQARRDRAAGLHTGTLVTGYPGSPLAGLDLQLARNSEAMAELDIRHIPAGNEEQAATALMGSQMLDSYPHEQFAGVTGFWYGKGPGVDRAGDAIKHGNFAGTSERGSVVVLSGEDHEAKSSTMPFQQEFAFMSAGIPILYPGSVADIRRLGLHAVAMSRFSGCWVALKLVSQLCDGGETVDLGEPVGVKIPELSVGGEPFEKRADFSFFPGKNIDHERHLYDERHAAVLAYARENGLDRISGATGSGRVGIVTAGKSTADVLEALAGCGARPTDFDRLGIRLLDVALLYPLDQERIREFAQGLSRIIVVEEKRDLLETGVRSALQPLGRPIEVIGKRDAAGNVLFPVHGAMDADLVLQRLQPALIDLIPELDHGTRLGEIEAVTDRHYQVLASRTPNFCSGCPHSASTVLAEGQVAWGAPGCGCFNTVIEQPQRHIDTMTQYGGEGLPWIGLEPFTERDHIVQHVGDGSIYHSSYLNIRFAVAAGARMTFKVLYNGAVANTGAQEAVGARGVANLVRSLTAEGVKQIIIATKEPARYRRESLDHRTVKVRRADAIVESSVELAQMDGVTVLLYDESCANERRRQQKRGLLPTPDKQLVINTAVCENCGDCGTKSNCMSLQKVETEFGPKTQIHASSCNFDYSCLEGDCPSFVTVELAEGVKRRRPAGSGIEFSELPPAPRRPLDREPYRVLMPGVGGTGVITTNAIVAVAAQLDGIASVSYDQTGAAQKWGPVLSSLTLRRRDQSPGSNKVGLAQADLLLALDSLGSAAAVNLDRCLPARTGLVMNTDLFPTGEMIRDVWHELDEAALKEAILGLTDPDRQILIPARTLAEKLFGDYMLTNTIVLGAALQAGELPISAESLEAAIEINGTGVEANKHALFVGRQWVVDPTPLLAEIAPAPSSADQEMEGRRDRLGKHAVTFENMMGQAEGQSPELRRILAIRTATLIDYQSPRYAQRYLDKVLEVASAEAALPMAEGQLSTAVAINLFKLMAYKDEYEVPRLLLDEEFRARVAEEYDGEIKLSYNLHPPFARRLGRKSKITVGRGARPVLRALRAGRRLRGTKIDPFALQAARREERGLIDWYESIVAEIVEKLRPDNLRVATELAEVPDEIRGYEEVKARNAVRAKLRSEPLRKRLDKATASLDLVEVKPSNDPS